jgi:integrase
MKTGEGRKRNPRGVRELEPRSGIYYAVYADATGKIRREKGGTRTAAHMLYRKRKTEVLEGKKLPDRLRQRSILFSELADEALEYSKTHKLSYLDDMSRMKKLRDAFGNRAAESIMPQDIERWLSTNEGWKPATFNRYKALLSLVYRLGIQNGKTKTNPARLVKTRRENNARTRYLLPEEETRLREAIGNRCPERLPEFELSLHTGMRRGEQYGLTWEYVNLDQNLLTIPRSKHGGKRHVFLNDSAIAALRVLWTFSKSEGRVFANGYSSEKTKGAREWFQNCLVDAGIKNFTWHSLRHTFGSRLVMAGVDIRTVQELMGHLTITMTLRYSHLAPQHQLAAVQRLCDTVATQKGATDSRTDSSADPGLVQKGLVVN